MRKTKIKRKLTTSFQKVLGKNKTHSGTTPIHIKAITSVIYETGNEGIELRSNAADTINIYSNAIRNTVAIKSSG